MAGSHTEAVLNKLTKPELVQLLLNTKANMGAQISTLTAEVKDLSSYLKKLEADVAIVKNVNSRLLEQLVRTKRQWWENAQYSRRKCLESIGIPTSVKDDVLEEKVCGIFHELGVEIGQRDIQACHRIKTNRTKLKLSNRKDCLQVLRAKKRLKDLDGTTLNLPSDTKIFINESCCGYFGGLWNKCKRLKGDKKIHQFYTKNGIIHLKLVQNDSVKTITHVNNLKDLFFGIDIDNL